MVEEHHLPLSLRERLSDRTEISMFEQWRQVKSSPVHTVVAGSETYFQSQRAAFVPRQPYHDLQELITACVKDDVVLNKEVHSCTWRDVADQALAAEKEYNRRDPNSRFRLQMREQLPSLAARLQPFKELFPDDYGMSVVAGGLWLIFSAVAKIGENRTKIFQFFDEIPTIMSQAENMHQFLPRDPELNDCMSDLRESVVLGLCGLLRILQPKHKRPVLQRLNLSNNGSRALHSVFSAESTAKQIDNIQKSVNDSKSKFDDCANGLTTKMLKETHSASEDSLREAKAIRKTQHATRHEVKEGFDAIQRELKASREQYAAGMKEAERLQAQNACYILVQDGLRCANVIFIESSPNNAMALQPPEAIMRLEELVSILNVNSEDPIDDLLSIVGQRQIFEADVARIASGILNDDRFRHWLGYSHSSALLIEDFGTTLRIGDYSPTAIFSGMLITSLPLLSRQDQRPHYVSYYFCSLHSDPNVASKGPSGMLRSLVMQLILSVSSEELNRLNLSFIKSNPNLMARFKQHELAALCEIYCVMVRQLSRYATIICIIDEVGDFETDDLSWRAEICYVVQQLRQLVQQTQHTGPAFKLCLTNSSKTANTYDYLLNDECISPATGPFVGPYLTEDAFLDNLGHASEESQAMGLIEAPSSDMDNFSFLSSPDRRDDSLLVSRPRSADSRSSPQAIYSTIDGDRSQSDIMMSFSADHRRLS